MVWDRDLEQALMAEDGLSGISTKMDYWYRQSPDQPLFPGLLWSRPENRHTAGKLLIVGGNIHGFAAPADAYLYAARAGIGTMRVVVPSALAKILGTGVNDSITHGHGDIKSKAGIGRGAETDTITAMAYAPSTPSGSFSQKALAEILNLAQWADAVLVAGDFGRNSETAILLEKLAGAYHGQLILTGDAVDCLLASPSSLLERDSTLLVLSFAQLQKLATAAHAAEPFTSQQDLAYFIAALHGFSARWPTAHLLVNYLQYSIVAANGKISSTPCKDPTDNHRTNTPDIPILQTAAQAAVWWLQTPDKPFEALTLAVLRGQ